MRPVDLNTRIFLDGGDPAETAQAIKLLGFLDGQTTNPTLISKNPEAAKRLAEGKKFSREEIFDFYKNVVKEISLLIPKGSISIEVYADEFTSADQMFNQGREMFTWIPNAHIKYPTTKAGLEAAEKSIKEEMRVNMTLVFSQQQAAAVYCATKGAKKGDVFVSPFIGRLDDQGQNGMNLIENITKMYAKGDGHAEVLAASVRNMYHFLYAVKLSSDIMTVPFKILKEWTDTRMLLPDENFVYNSDGLRDIPYAEIDLTKNWTDFDISHPLTQTGIQRFSNDWNSLIS